MTLNLLLFYAFAAVTSGAAIAVISVRNPVHAVLFLVLTFFSAACVWMLLEAEFLAITLVLVYVGAVMVLFLFVVMMLDVKISVLREGFVRYLPVGIVVATIMAAELFFVVGLDRFELEAPMPNPEGYSHTQALGVKLYTEYVLPFEVAGVLLLIAIIAAIVLTHRRRDSVRQQNPSKQVQVRAEDRLEIIKMDAEGEEGKP